MIHNLHFKPSLAIATLVLLMLVPGFGWGVIPGPIPYVMSGGDYAEAFTNIANTTNWPNGFNGTDCTEWGSVAVNATGTVGDGIKISTSTATFVTGSSGGVQRGTANIQMLSTSTANSCAIDLFLDFTARNAGTISFDVATVFNSTGDRDSKLKLFYSTNGTTYTEITGTNLPYTARNNVASSASITTIALPVVFNNSATARLRLYEFSTTTGGTPAGSQPKISIDNIAVTSTPYSNTAPLLTASAVSSIGATSATFNGNISSDGGSAITDRGFCYKITTGVAITDNPTSEGGTTTGTYSKSITLSAGTSYFYKAYAINGIGTTLSSNEISFWTFSTEPSTHTTTFTNSVFSQTQIDLSFDALNTISNAAGYLILKKTGSAPTGIPTDGTAYTVGTAVGDGTVATLVTSSSATSASIGSLSAGTSYYFTIIPYNYNGANNETNNYKTDGTIPGTNGTTSFPNDADSYVNVPATQADPVLISSLADTDPEAVEVFKFKINDVGTDGYPTKVTQVTVFPAAGNIANWANAIQGVKLSIDGGSTFVTTGTPVISVTSLVFPITTGNLNVANGSSITISLFVYLKTSGLTDNQIMQFQVPASSHGFVADATGSTFLTTFSGATTSNQMLIDVVSSKLKFVQQPGSTLVNSTMSPAVTIEATDANNNRDHDKTGSVAFTSTGTMTGPVTASLTLGFGTAGNIVHTTTGNSLTLTASLSGLTDAVSNLFSVFAALAPGDILFIGYGTDDPDKFAFLVMNAIPEGTQISFTDNAWTGGVLTSNENTGIYSVPAGGLAKGAIIQIQGTTVTGGGTMSGGLTGLSTSGDQILAYQGSSLSPGFIAGVSSTNWITTGVATSNQSYLPVSLAVYSTAVSFSTEEDNGYYSGPMTLANGALPSLICNAANWTRSATIQTFPSWSFTIGNNTLIDITATAQNITINTGESLSINSGKGFSVNGTLTNNAGTSALLVKSGGSLIDNNAGVSATVERDITTGLAAWHLFISPLTTSVSASATSLFLDAFLDKFVEADGAWSRLVTNDQVQPLTGYSINFPSGTHTLSFAGTLQASPVAYSDMSYTAAAPGYGPGYHLVGNPYPCGINPALCSTPAGMNATAYVWDGTQYLTPSMGASTIPGTIAALQGFFIRTSSGTNNLTLANVAKINAGAFMKNSNSVPEMLKLSVNGNGYSDKTYVRYFAESTPSFDQAFDAYKLFGIEAAPQLYSILPDEIAAVNTLPGIETNSDVAVGFKAGAENTYTLEATGIESFDAETPLLLEDLMTNTTQDLRQNPVYSFTAAPGDMEHRFNLHFKKANGIDETVFKQIGIYSNRNMVYISNPNSLPGSIDVYDITGRLISSTHLTGNLSDKVDVGKYTGILLVKVITLKEISTGKVFVN